MELSQSHAYAVLIFVSLFSMAVFVNYIDAETTKNNAIRAAYDAWCPGGPRGTPTNPALQAYLPYAENQTQVNAYCLKAAPSVCQANHPKA